MAGTLKNKKEVINNLFTPLKPGKVTVPVHGSKDIPPGTMGSIFKQAGIKKPKF